MKVVSLHSVLCPSVSLCRNALQSRYSLIMADKKPRILILTQYYVPESGAPQNRWHSLATRLADLGHKVSVLTAMPNYPTGRIFDGYRGKLFHREQMGKIDVHRTWLYATPSKKMSRRLINYFSFAWMSLLYGLLAIRSIDLLIYESPPLFLGPCAWLLARLKGARCVMNVSDLWPESAVALGMISRESKANRIAEKLEMWLYRHSDAVTGQTEGIVESISRRVPGKRVALFPNGVDLEMFTPLPADASMARQLGLEGKFVVGYGGIIGYAQALEQVLAAAELLKDEPRVVFAFFGDGPVKSDLIAEVRVRGLDNVRFFERQDRTAMPKVISLWNVGLVPLADKPLFDGARPSKMFELMGQGKAILFCGRGEGAQIVSKNQCGIVVAPEKPAELAAAVRQSLADEAGLEQMGRNARVTGQEQFDRAKIAQRISDLFVSLTA